jgi:hypothetical protein
MAETPPAGSIHEALILSPIVIRRDFIRRTTGRKREKERKTA